MKTFLFANEQGLRRVEISFGETVNRTDGFLSVYQLVKCEIRSAGSISVILSRATLFRDEVRIYSSAIIPIQCCRIYLLCL